MVPRSSGQAPRRFDTARARVNALTGLEPLSPDSTQYYSQMVSIRLPEGYEASIRQQLEERGIVVVVLRVEGQLMMRASFQAYNSQEDVDLLVEAVAEGLARKGEGIQAEET